MQQQNRFGIFPAREKPNSFSKHDTERRPTDAESDGTADRFGSCTVDTNSEATQPGSSLATEGRRRHTQLPQPHATQQPSDKILRHFPCVRAHSHATKSFFALERPRVTRVERIIITGPILYALRLCCSQSQLGHH